VTPAGAPRDEAAIQEGLFGQPTLLGSEQTDLLGPDAGKRTWRLKGEKIGPAEVARVRREGTEPEGARPGDLWGTP
jgi:hypothetical protein